MSGLILHPQLAVASRFDETSDAKKAPGVSPESSCFTLVWDGPGAAPSRGPADLSAFLRQMRSGDRFDVVFRRTPYAEGGLGSIDLQFHPAAPNKMGASGSSTEHPLSKDLKAKLRALTSDYSILDARPSTAKNAALLRPVSPLSDSESYDDPEAFLASTRPTPVDFDKETAPVIAGGPKGLSIDVEHALSALVRSEMGFELTLSLQAFELSLPERISISRAMRENAPYPELFFQDPGLARRRIHTLESLRRWIMSPSGLRLVCGLHLDGPAGPEFPVMISHLLFPSGAGDVVGYGLAGDALDLSMSFPVGSPLPALVPSPVALEHLDFIQLGIPRAASRSQTTACVVGETMSGADVTIPDHDLARHAVVVGSTGVGKSSLLRQMISQAIGLGQ